MPEQSTSPEPEGARLLAGPGFPGDTGGADPAVTAALTAYGSGQGSYAAGLVALSQSRLLVPVVAVLGEVEYDEHGLAHDKTSDMATVLLTGADGRTALLAFTSMASLQAWQPDARPVPVTARDAARAAVQDGADAIVVDLAGPVRFVIEGQELRAVAEGGRLVLLEDGSAAWIRPGQE